MYACMHTYMLLCDGMQIHTRIRINGHACAYANMQIRKCTHAHMQTRALMLVCIHTCQMQPCTHAYKHTNPWMTPPACMVRYIIHGACAYVHGAGVGPSIYNSRVCAVCIPQTSAWYIVVVYTFKKYASFQAPAVII